MPATKTNSKYTKSFLRWPGSKFQLLPEILDLIDREKSSRPFNLLEPFCGSGVVSLNVLRKFPNAIVYASDTELDLINTWIVIKKRNTFKEIKDHLYDLNLAYLSVFERNNSDSVRTLYNKIRERFNACRNRKKNPRQAARMIFLSQTNFNGLFRKNLAGRYNTPVGKYKNPRNICNDELLEDIHELIQDRFQITICDYKDQCDLFTPNDIFYFDPPYHPISKTSRFNQYGAIRFSESDQKTLKDKCDCLDQAGAKFILSNSDCEFIRDLYQAYSIHQVTVNRSIAADASRRNNKHPELLITNIFT